MQPTVVEQGLALLRGLGSHGLAHVEVKRDPRDGLFKLVEVNSRLWQFHSLATASGVNFPLVAYLHLTGAQVEPPSNGKGHGRWAITFKADRMPAPARPPYHDPLLARDEPGIALSHARFMARAAARSVRRRLRPWPGRAPRRRTRRVRLASRGERRGAGGRQSATARRRRGAGAGRGV